MAKTQQEVIRQGYQALIDSLGVVDAIRFVQYFRLGKGDYTLERHQWLDQIPLEEILQSMRKYGESDGDRYDEIY